ncbi:MAG TPA: hypothetical protein VJ654_00670 [Noviherbaspirillum sp.]|nr:hypothetical protein [Noviherbaspirillum sp.]
MTTEQIRERPILFSAPMVRAILDGSKTQTRRIVKPQPLRIVTESPGKISVHWEWKGQNLAATGVQQFLSKCPYGQPGDGLWVRESFWGCDMPGYGDQPCVVYDDEWHGKEYAPAETRPWARKFGRIPSIHMPRDCSRILLEITAVRVERLQDITEADAQAEGCQSLTWDGTAGPADLIDWPIKSTNRPYTNDYALLWESINGPGSWEANPWVWVIEFRRLKP